MEVLEKHGIVTYHFRNLAMEPAVQHFVSARVGGVSRPPYDSLNVSFTVHDDFAAVKSNRQQLARAVDIPLSQFVGATQIHGDTIAQATVQDSGRGSDSSATAIPDTDALITDQSNICLTITIADCVPVLLYDPEKQAVGVVHAGFKGTMLQVTSKTIAKMTETFGTNPRHLIVGIGPSIGRTSYQISWEMAEQSRLAFGQETIIHVQNGDYYCDLWEANLIQLQRVGVPREQIELAGIDTFTNTDMFFSDRQARPTGRFMAAIMLQS